MRAPLACPVEMKATPAVTKPAAGGDAVSRNKVAGPSMQKVCARGARVGRDEGHGAWPHSLPPGGTWPAARRAQHADRALT